jgi:hypothetical protein
VPFSFRPEHPRRCSHPDFALFAAANPDEARQYFDESLVAAFHYSWRTLASLVGERVSDDDSYGSVLRAATNPWLHIEFHHWGLILANIWAGIERLLVFKLFGALERTWNIPSSHWLLDDGITPRVYRMEELALEERQIVQPSEDADDPVDEYPTLSVVHPNIGPQHPGESSGLALLMPGYGFVNGKLHYIDVGHDEWVLQNGRSRPIRS